MTDPRPFLALCRRVLEAYLPPEEARQAALELLVKIDQAPIPSCHEVARIRRDWRIRELLNQGVPADVVALRLDCDRSTVYRAQARARALRLVA